MGFVKDSLAGKLVDVATLRDLCFYLGTHFVQPDSAIIDLGTGNGEAIAPFVRACPDDNSFILVDNEIRAIAGVASRYGDDRRVKCLATDLSKDYPPFQTSLTLAVCTLQHIPLSTRWRILRSAFNKTLPGGALILVEQVVSQGYLDEIYNQQNNAKIFENATILSPLDFKPEGSPVTVAMNEQLLHDAGFRIVDCFYKYLNYAAWIAIKDE